MDEYGGGKTFLLVINVLFANWKLQHVTIGLFEANDTTSVGLTKQLKAFLETFGLKSKVLCYVKNEGTNWETMITTLKSTISCEVLNLSRFYSIC
jgi:hypothetical protein